MTILGFEMSINELVKIFAIYLSSIFIYIKLSNFKSITIAKVIGLIVMCATLSLIYNLISLELDFAIAFLSTSILFSLMVKVLIKDKSASVMSLSILSLATGYLLSVLSSAIVTTVSITLYNPAPNSNIFEQLSTSTLLMVLSYFVFKIPRIKNWWYSLHNNKIGENEVYFQ